MVVIAAWADNHREEGRGKAGCRPAARRCRAKSRPVCDRPGLQGMKVCRSVRAIEGAVSILTGARRSSLSC